MKQNVEYGKFDIVITTNFFFNTSYAVYYSEEQSQLYLIDFGIHKYWLGFFGALTPIFFRFISFKSYPIKDDVIKQIKGNFGFMIINFVLIMGSVISTLMMSAAYSKYRFANKDSKLLTINDFFKDHIFFTILLWLLTMLTIIGVTSYFISIYVKNKKYYKTKIIARLVVQKKFKFIFLGITTILFFMGLSIYGFLFRNILIFLSILFFLFIFNGPSSFSQNNKNYTGKIIFEDMD